MACEREEQEVELAQTDVDIREGECEALGIEFGPNSSEYRFCQVLLEYAEERLQRAQKALTACREGEERIGTRLAEGRVTLLRVHEAGGFGGGSGPNATNNIDADVIFQLDSEPAMSFGFKLRQDSRLPMHGGMLNLLRDALINDLTVRVDYLQKEPIPDRNVFAVRVTILKPTPVDPTRAPSFEALGRERI